MRNFVLTLAVFLSMALLADKGHAKSASPIGSWSGGGTVSPKGGARERVRCRISIRKAAGRGRYSTSSRCSTSAGMVNQSAIVKKTGASSYSGRFNSAQYGSGSIYMTVRGRRLSVSVRGSKGRASLGLRR